MRKIIVSVGVISALTLCANFLGFVREVFFAQSFGLSIEADAYIAGFSIVATCFLVLAAGALQGAFMPRYQALVATDPDLALGLWKQTWVVLSALLSVMGFILFFGSDVIVSWVVPGFDTSAKALVAQVVRWLSPMVFFVGLGVLFQSVLHSNQLFFLPATIPVLNNVVLIGTLVLIVPTMGFASFSYGTVLGAALWIILLPSVMSCLPHGKAKLESQEFFKLLAAILPLIILIVSDQLSALVQKVLLSELEVGSIAAINYASKLQGLPVGVFAAAIATVYFPALVNALARRNQNEVSVHFREGVAFIGLFSVPAMVFLVVEPYLITRVLFERGAFDYEASARVAEALRYFALGLFPQSMIVFLNKIYFAGGNTRVPMLIGVASAVLHVVFCWVLVKGFGYLGVAISTSLYALIYFVLLLLFLRGFVGRIIPTLFAVLWRQAVAGFLMALLLVSLDFETSLMGLLQALFAAGGGYLVLALLLRDEAIKGLLSFRF